MNVCTYQSIRQYTICNSIAQPTKIIEVSNNKMRGPTSALAINPLPTTTTYCQTIIMSVSHTGWYYLLVLLHAVFLPTFFSLDSILAKQMRRKPEGSLEGIKSKTRVDSLYPKKHILLLLLYILYYLLHALDIVLQLVPTWYTQEETTSCSLLHQYKAYYYIRYYTSMYRIRNSYM